MYSLGVTLFELLTGQRPFLADNAGALFIKHATETPPSPSSLNSTLSRDANNLVLRLLKKEPKQRFETYDQLIEAIDAVLHPKKPQLQSKPTRRMSMKSAPDAIVTVARSAPSTSSSIATAWMSPSPVAKIRPLTLSVASEPSQ